MEVNFENSEIAYTYEIYLDGLYFFSLFSFFLLSFPKTNIN